MSSKTRERLIEVARQLFAHKGVNHTTMLDIANASKKGRRTIYTYFKNKNEIQNAVLDRESDRIIAKQREVYRTSLPPAQKLRKFLEIKFESMCEPTAPKDISALFNLNFQEGQRTASVRRLALKKEADILRAILDEGVSAGVFSPVQSRRAGALIPTISNEAFSNVKVGGKNLDAAGMHKVSTLSIDFIMEAIVQPETTIRKQTQESDKQ